MTDKEAMKLALEAGIGWAELLGGTPEFLEAFAKLVREDEREKFLGALRQLHDSYSLASDSNGLKARGQA